MMYYNQYPNTLFNYDYFLQQQALQAQQAAWQQQQEIQARQEWLEQQEHIMKAAHALSDFMKEASQIKEPYRTQAAIEFMAVLGWNASGGMR